MVKNNVIPLTTSYPKRMLCPLTNTEIDSGICFDIHMVVEGCAPDYTAPHEAVSIENFKDICNSCKYHRDD